MPRPRRGPRPDASLPPPQETVPAKFFYFSYLDSADQLNGGEEGADAAESASTMRAREELRKMLKSAANGAMMAGFMAWAGAEGHKYCYIWSCPPNEGGAPSSTQHALTSEL